MSLEGRLSIVLKCGWRRYGVAEGEQDWATKRVFAFWREHARGHLKDVFVIACGRYSWPFVANVDVASGRLREDPDREAVVLEQMQGKFEGEPPEGCNRELDAIYWGCCAP